MNTSPWKNLRQNREVKLVMGPFNAFGCVWHLSEKIHPPESSLQRSSVVLGQIQPFWTLRGSQHQAPQPLGVTVCGQLSGPLASTGLNFQICESH